MTGYESKRAAARDKMAQEPVGWLCKADQHGLFDPPTPDKACKDCFPVYAEPPQRPWVGLTEEEIKKCFKITPDLFLPWHIYTKIEAKLKEKNS